MSKFYTLGSYTDQALAGFIKNPNDDRSAVIRTLLESVGGKVVLFDILRGTSDFIMCVEELDFEALASVKVAVQSTGMVKDFMMFEVTDMGKIASDASKALASYKKPGE
jgi:uncharacterized protein with GYD domain|tara:strand:+ start:1628 stop:1954 length:327 start_codon:yes stop_codon:yes gene_type:complete